MAADDRSAKTWFIRTAIISISPSPIYLMISDTDPDGPATFFIHHFTDQLSDHLLVLKVMWSTDSKCVK